MKRSYIYTCALFILILSCQPKNEAMEVALRLAGNNRGELEKVLYHYSRYPADSLKLKAAEFLIENMPGHYTLDGPLINEYREKLFADTSFSYFTKKALDISLSRVDGIREASCKREDIEHLKADFLVRHIDLSFEDLYRYTWLKDLPFNLFLEYLLPYRFENERPDLWRDSSRVAPDVLQRVCYDESKKYTVAATGNYLLLSMSLVYINFDLSRVLLGRNIYKDCYHIALQENFKCRISSLPGAMDYIPQYATRNGYHYWNNIISPESKSTEVRGALERKTAKVFRKTYSRHPVPVPVKDEYIPEAFLDPFFVDVSEEYLHTSDIVVRIDKRLQQKSLRHAYLCVFNNLAWKPIAMGEVKKARAEFPDMGKNLVYLPVYYRGKDMQPLDYPFILNLKGEVKQLVPDTCNREKIVLKRKYP